MVDPNNAFTGARIRITIRNTPEGRRIQKELEELKRGIVHVGFQNNGAAYSNGLTLPEVAALNEYGGAHRPPRPFMWNSFDLHQPELKKICQDAYKIILAGGDAKQALYNVGSRVKGVIQEEIDDGEYAPNAPSTIERKGSSHPLIDSAHMRQNVNFVIEMGESHR